MVNRVLTCGGSNFLRQTLDVGTAKQSGRTSDQQGAWEWQHFVLNDVGLW